MNFEHAFGGIITPEDPRNYNLGATLVPNNPSIYLPSGWDTTIKEDQKQQPACGAHASAGADTYKKGSRRSPRYQWKNIKDIDGYPIESGTDINSIFKVWKNKGICSFDLTGNPTEIDQTIYRNLDVTPQMDSDASKFKIDSYAIQYSPTFDQLKQAIYKYGAVIILFRVGRNTYTRKDGVVSYLEKDILPLSPDNFPMDGGHFVYCTGYDENYIYWANSWGNRWGRNGVGYFGADYMKYVVAMGTFIPSADVTPSVLPKYNFTRDLTLGSTGDDVTALQKLLMASGDLVMPVGVAFGWFGLLTQAALAKFQLKNGITPSVGYMGSKTRLFISQMK